MNEFGVSFSHVVESVCLIDVESPLVEILNVKSVRVEIPDS